MGRLTKIKNSFNKKGQLFLIEVFIALSVLILMMIAIYQVEFTSDPTYQDDLSEIGYNALESMNKAGNLKPFVYKIQTSEFADNLENILPENVLWRLSVDDDIGNNIFQIYLDRTPPADVSVGVTDYFLFGYESDLNQFRVIHLVLWRLLG
ncbi:MAG: hypothetical protein HZR80_03440 [Candidatus Heimdallarchaeota archaeon]